MHKPVLVVTTHFMDKIEERIDRDYDARRRNGTFFSGNVTKVT